MTSTRRPYVVKKNDTIINDPYLNEIIESMIDKRLTLDKACTIDPFPARHFATFITGTSNWREKAGLGREFDKRGQTGLLFWPTCRNECYQTIGPPIWKKSDAC
ncbi:MAG: hypothetical protein Barrevirus8_4 [Barrevirus sp.]|uniref:Uncharacterized protein n=1 Tax=Barrevirus sp. TaxID=2487763 RepID=A0A3G4ZQ37_9VIRU|nr:MAG: hypothetical protein Barrevirus8_4 [Barrevirus sp.]